MKKIIDVSQFNGEIDLAKAAKDIDGLIARCSWGWGNGQFDTQWFHNAQQANALHVPLFAYHFAYAKTKEEAVLEAKLALSACRNYEVNVIYYDIEYSEFQGDLTPEEYYEIAKAFCDEIEANGYAVGIYANEYYFKTKLINAGFSKWTLWLANYGNNDGYDNWDGRLEYNPFGHVLIHQFTSNAKKGVLKGIEGIPSEELDCSADFGLLETFVKKEEVEQVIKVNSKVKVKPDATWYDGSSIPSFVFDSIYTVLEIRNDRVVIGKHQKVTGAIRKEDLIVVV